MAALSGGVLGAIAASSAMSDDDERIAKKVNNFMCQILPKLDKAAITKRGDKLSDAFCLLWHHRSQGEVHGRQSDDTLITCLYATVLIDLWLAEKIEIEVMEEETCFGVSLKATVKVIDETKTNSCLDAAGFNRILRAHSKGKSKKLKEWLVQCVEYFADDNCASVILDSFVEKGIMGKEAKWFGLKTDYPTQDKQPQIKLVLEIRQITLKEKVPDAFMSTLLSILRFTDKLRDGYDIMLRRHYNKEEYDQAKPSLNKILRRSGYVDDF